MNTQSVIAGMRAMTADALINCAYYRFFAGVMLYLHWCELNAADEDRGVENADPPPLAEPALSLLKVAVPDERQRDDLIKAAFAIWFDDCMDWDKTISRLMHYVELQVMIGRLKVCG